MRGLIPAGAGWPAAMSPVKHRTGRAVRRVASVTDRTWLVPKAAGTIGEVPRLLVVSPPVACLLVASLACLLGNARLVYAPNYAPPTRFATIDSASDYAAMPLAKGGWAILGFSHSDLGYQEVDGAGRTSVS